MKQHFIIKNNQKHLLLFFAGWGMDETPFLQIQPRTDNDWLICYDYRSLEFDAIILQEYSEITLIAWSMGVWAASQIMKQYPSLPLSQSIAINGTPYPIHETKGITLPFRRDIARFERTILAKVSKTDVWFNSRLQNFSDSSSPTFH